MSSTSAPATRTRRIRLGRICRGSRDHQHEFGSLVKERLGSEAAEAVGAVGAVDWSNPRLVCIAGDFTHHDMVAIEMIGRRIDLVSYRASTTC
ncbi:hypothetical protein G7Z12_37265 [Streptomyces sp. ID38640]|uniref:hypothetical protein n=1 Tax=Streptomyces sp. ID38640 TaxID=1265399 RepID=UPI00140EE75A|nr:hypothetical protein [Streptomyces sp. ID38640]QIK10865.1 hypothetical protein G7Z12_37265 [Streptomyces sp. ID38640]